MLPLKATGLTTRRDHLAIRRDLGRQCVVALAPAIALAGTRPQLAGQEIWFDDLLDKEPSCVRANGAQRYLAEAHKQRYYQID
jgi:hypothetical protein